MVNLNGRTQIAAAVLSLAGVTIGGCNSTYSKAEEYRFNPYPLEPHSVLSEPEALSRPDLSKVDIQTLEAWGIDYHHHNHFWEQLATDMAELGLSQEQQYKVATYIQDEMMQAPDTTFSRPQHREYLELPELLSMWGYEGEIPRSLQFISDFSRRERYTSPSEYSEHMLFLYKEMLQG